MWMNFQRAAKANCRFAKLVQRHVAETLTRSGAKMIRIARQSFLAIRDRTGVVFPHETHRGALVPAFWKVRSNFDHAREFGFCCLEPALLHSIYAGAKNSIRLRAS